jgi:uncharacterized membrane protein
MKASKYAQQELSEITDIFTFHSGIRMWGNVSMDEIYVVLTMFVLMGIVQMPTLGSYYSKNHLLFIPLFLENLPLKKWN